MKVLFSALSAYGHIFPMIPLALAVQEADHEVRFATAADFGTVLEKAGLHALTASQPLNTTATSIHGVRTYGDDISPEGTLRLASRVLGEVVPREFVTDLAPIIRDFDPDLVIFDQGNPGGGLAARLAGVPAVCHGFGRALRGALSTACNHYLRPYAAELGITLPAEYAAHLGDRTIDICPPSLQREDFLAPGNRIAMRPVSFAESGDLPHSVKDDGSGRPLAYVTLGTIYGAADLLREVIAGLLKLDMRVLVATGPSVDPAELGAQPDSVSIEPWVPQARVWPYVDLAVHHGGSGTMLGALAGGVRQLVIPQAEDQPSNARAITKAGAGLFMAPERVTGQSVTEYAGLVLGTESFAVETRRLRAEIEAMPGPDELARRLPDLV